MTHKAAGMRHAHTCAAQRQKGIALFIVVVLVMLSMLLALWASRSALFNEMFVGNDADYQRALEAAQALLQDAELDIRGEQASGAACAASSSQPSVCRSGAGIAQFPGKPGKSACCWPASLRPHPLDAAMACAPSARDLRTSGTTRTKAKGSRWAR